MTHTEWENEKILSIHNATKEQLKCMVRVRDNQIAELHKELEEKQKAFDEAMELLKIQINDDFNEENGINKRYFEIKKGQYGFLDDGRDYKVVSIPSITMCSDGTLKYGDVVLNIDDEFYTIRISEFVEHVKIIGNLAIKI